MTPLRPRRDPEPWNHNIHYHRVVLAAAPGSCRRALDVGCGEGLLTRRLRARSEVVVGLDRDRRSIALACEARSRLPADLGRELAAVAAHRWFRLRKTLWEHPSPVVWPPPETYAGMRAIAEDVLPGTRFRRHLLWRYSLVWTKPA